MPARKWDHKIHKYQKVVFRSKKKKGKETEIWRCMLTNCQHYLVGEMVIGKLSLCNRCGDPFEMREANLQQKKPHCVSCTRPYNQSGKSKKPDLAYIAKNLEDLLRTE